MITNDSGVSWGVLVTFGTVGLGLMAMLWKTISVAVDKAADKMIRAVEKLELKVDLVERGGRADYEKLWDEHLRQRDAVVKISALQSTIHVIRKDVERLKERLPR